MSFILEALKKSENERQRQIGPSLADVPARMQRTERPWWAFAVAALLLFNLAVLLVVLLRDGDAAPVAPSAAAVAPVETSAPPAAASPAPAAVAPVPAQPRQTSVNDPAVRSLADEAYPPELSNGGFPAGHPDLAVAATVPDGPPIVRSIDAPAPAALDRSPPAQFSQPRVPTEVLPTLRELTASGTNLPELHLDIHVHSQRPAERFVFVNMRKYIEGQTLSEGPTIEQITSDGVILNQGGLRFLLPRQ